MNSFSFLVDVYSFGVIAYETVGRKLLFADLVQHALFDEIKVRRAVLAGERPPIIDAYPYEPTPEKVHSFFIATKSNDNNLFKVFLLFTELVDACWHQQPMQRPQFPAILSLLHKLQDLYREASTCVSLDPQQLDAWHSLLLTERMKVREESAPLVREEPIAE
jgi:hypothetical protein